MDEIVKVCFDKVLPQDLSEAQNTVRSGDRLRAVFEFRKMWINGSILRVRFMGGTTSQRAMAKEQALWWTEHANLRFDFNNALDAEIPRGLPVPLETGEPIRLWNHWLALCLFAVLLSAEWILRKRWRLV